MSDVPAVKNELMQRPDWMTEEEKIGVENIAQYIRPPRFKLIQPQAKGEFASRFNKGDIVLLPQMEVVFPVTLDAKSKPTDTGAVGTLVPVFFFTEWCVWNPIQVTNLDAIRERTFDPGSVIARKAKNKETWFEKCPENPEFNIRYVEHLNFIVVPTSPCIVQAQPVVMSFSRGGYRDGALLLSLIQLRDASIFGLQFEFNSKLRVNPKGEYFGIDFRNPTEATGADGWIRDRVTYGKLKDLHLQFKEAHADNLIIVDRDDDEIMDSEVPNSKGEF